MKDIIAKMAAGMSAEERAKFDVYVALLDPNPAVIFWGEPRKSVRFQKVWPNS